MNKKKHITWKDIKSQIEKMNLDTSLKYYGVPRGGQPISALLNPADTPEEADIIIDDLIDSGATRDKYKALYPDKEFIALFEKGNKKEWFIFPWEVNEVEIDIEEHFRRVLQYFDNTNREGLKETPKRYIKFLTQFLNPPKFEFTTFKNEGIDQMITQTNIPFYSLCEHHIAPFFGTAKVSYIPKDKIVGLSKLARTVDLYANKLQNQERITTQVAERLMKELDAKGVGVQLKAQHLCMAMRGVKKHDTYTTTTCLLGNYKESEVRKEFLDAE